MTKKDYELIARVISKELSHYIAKSRSTIEYAREIEAIKGMAGELAVEFGYVNPSFDWHKFMKSCRINLD